MLFVLVLFAALIAPNLVSMRSAQERRGAYGQVSDLVQEARLDAVNDNATYALTWDAQASSFDLKKEPPNQQNSASSNSSMAVPEPRPLQGSQSISDFQQVKALALPSPLKADTFRVATQVSDPGSWAIHFYPDGSSDGGGVEIVDGTGRKSLVVDRYGLSKLSDGPLPDPNDQKWTAGTYAQKT